MVFTCFWHRCRGLKISSMAVPEVWHILITSYILVLTIVVRITSYQQRLASWHNRCVKPCTFKARELVLRRVFENTSNLADEKLQLNWEGPYIVVLVGPVNSYALNRTDGVDVLRMWNSMHLKKYYQYCSYWESYHQ